MVSTVIELKFKQGLEHQAVNEWANEPKGVIEGYEHSLEAVEDLLLRMDEDKKAGKDRTLKLEKKRNGGEFNKRKKTKNDCEGMIYNVRKCNCNIGERNKSLQGYLSWK